MTRLHAKLLLLSARPPAAPVKLEEGLLLWSQAEQSGNGRSRLAP